MPEALLSLRAFAQRHLTNPIRSSAIAGATSRIPARSHRNWLEWSVRPLYRLYEHWLTRQVEGRTVPRHIGIILDGNRRYGARHGLHDPGEIYALGAGKLDDVLDWCGELAVPAVTLWVFSTDNLSRPDDQISGILAAVEA